MTDREMEEGREERVDAVLRSLGQAQVPEGMEARILSRLKERREVPERSAWLRSRPVWALAGAGLAAVLLLALYGLRPSRTVPAHGSIAAVAAVAVGSSRAVPRVAPPARVAPVRRVGKHRRVRPAESASFPAPEAPLTQQERLLLAIAHINQPAVLDALDPTRRAAVEAQDDHDFKAYVASVHHGGL